MALLTTFATTPLATLLYPPWYQEKLKAWRRGEIDWDTGAPLPSSSSPDDEPKPSRPSATDRVRRLLVYLTLDNMPSILDVVSLFGIAPTAGSHSHPADREEVTPQATSPRGLSDGGKAVQAHGIRLLQLTDRDSSVMSVSQVDEYSQFDPVVNIFRTMGQLQKLAVSGEVAVMPETRFAEALVSKSSAISSDLLLVPWDKTGGPGTPEAVAEAANSRLDSSYANIIRPVLQNTETNVGIFFPKAIGTHTSNPTPQRVKLTRAYSFSDIKTDNIPTIPVTNLSHHIFLPYFGGKDDELALTVVLQLCEKPDVTATVVHFSSASSEDQYFSSAAASSLESKYASRVKFETVPAEDGYAAALERAATEMQPESREVTSRKLIVLGRRTGLDAVGGKPSYKVVEEVREGLGAVGAHLVASGLTVDLLVVQAKASVGI